MIPFSRMIKYGNIVNARWWDEPDVLMAYDTYNFVPSTGFNTDGFNDYKGIFVQADAASTDNKFPILGIPGESVLNQFGSYGICLYGSALIANTSQIDPSRSTSDYTVDFWMRNSTAGENVLEIVPFVWCNLITTNNNKWCMWAYLKDSNGVRYQNNGSGPTRSKSSYSSMYADTNWHHFACTYVRSTNTHYIFFDGVLIDTFVYTVVTPGTPATKFGITGHVNSQGASGGSPAHTYIDRFRFRNTAVWTSNFNINTIYPT